LFLVLQNILLYSQKFKKTLSIFITENIEGGEREGVNDQKYGANCDKIFKK